MPPGPPENTLSAFDFALECGCDGFEFDVRLTGDERAVICHDPRVKGHVVADAGCGQLDELPQLEQVLEKYASRAFLDIELKVPGLEATTLALLKRHAPQRGVVLSSFLPEVIRELHSQDPCVPLGIICDTREQLVQWKDLAIEWVIPQYRLLTKELADEAHDSGVRLMVWTVNRPVDMERFAGMDVDAIVSDDPRLLVKTLAAKTP